MDWSERIIWLIAGGAIGYILGYLTRYFREMKEEIDEVDGIIKRHFGKREDDKEGGFMRHPVVADIAVVLALALTLFGVFKTAEVNNDLKDVQYAQGKVTVCNQEFLSRTIRALNDRTAFTIEQAEANIDLQKSQTRFFALLLEQPPRPEDARRKAGQDYLNDLTTFLTVSGQNKHAVEANPYPTNEELKKCLGL